MFSKINLYFDYNLFNDLSTTVNFDNISEGRTGAVLIDYTNNLVPIVRTTTKYINPVQKFQSIHYNIINKIKTYNNINFNNALIEIYDNNYRSMKYHSDQSLDLDDDSYICIFSCYSNDKTNNLRKLIVKNKINNIKVEYTLEHNSFILFSNKTNKQYLHKIILDKINNSDNIKWLGITFRLSKTFINFINNKPYFYNSNNILYLASDEEEKEYYKYRKQENNTIDYKYPEIFYTINPSDLII